MPGYKVHHEDDASDVLDVDADTPGSAANLAARQMFDRLTRIATPPSGLEGRVSETSVGGVFIVVEGKTSTAYFVLGDLNSGDVEAFRAE